MKKIYLIWIWWIWISAIARYYLENWYRVFWSDSTNSELIEKLKSEWCDIYVGNEYFHSKNKNKNICSLQDMEKIIYTEAISKNHPELIKAKELNLNILTYPESLAEIANSKKLITIAWTHWKSTTTSLISLVLKNSSENFTTVVWTILKEFNWKNFYHRNNPVQKDDYFILEACEYKRSFLAYNPFIAIITNIDLDHLDYYKDLEDYLSAFNEYINNIKIWWFAILNWNCKNSKTLIWKRNDINYIEIFNKYATFTNTKWDSEIITFPKIDMKVPWEHILFDAKIAYIVAHMLWIDDNMIIQALEKYTWVWRRMEIIWETENKNILMSDYWHHPTEIRLTLKALKDQNPARPILTVFQPHQYNRTLELLEEFKTCFYDTDKLIVPNIYESRDSEEDKKKINSSIFIENIKHDNKIDWENFENTLNLINKWNKENQFWIILLMWAWDIDNLRQKIKTI